ncbi:MAG TPA: ion transporter [Chitinophagaceae bacterium]|nr:ion transporter [Chitinophagaceae bacterium]
MYNKIKYKTHILLHPELGESRADKIINFSIITLIILNVIAVMLETVKSLHDQYETFFHYFDLFSVIIFTIEYVLRVWSCNHDPKYKHSIKGRIRYMLTWGAIIDLLAFLPYYLQAIVGFDLRMLRILRLLRFLRLFRLTAYMKSAKKVSNIFKSRKNELILSLVLALFLIIIASSILYFAEHNEIDSKFTSIPATVWWAVVTLTTTGYGDMIPETEIGKFLTGVIMLAGVAFFALPAGIITAGFLEEFRSEKKTKKQKCPHCGHEYDLNNHHDENHQHHEH